GRREGEGKSPDVRNRASRNPFQAPSRAGPSDRAGRPVSSSPRDPTVAPFVPASADGSREARVRGALALRAGGGADTFPPSRTGLAFGQGAGSRVRVRARGSRFDRRVVGGRERRGEIATSASVPTAALQRRASPRAG